LCWIAFFISYLVLIGTLVWTPGLMRKAGMDIGTASLMLSVNNIGGIVGLIFVGYFADRFRKHFWTLTTYLYIGGAVSIALMGYTAPSFWPVAVFSALTGVFMASGFGVLYSFAAHMYPTFVRSTGVGWASGLGRVGSSMGPLVVGWMFAGGWQVSSTLYMLGALAAVNIVIVSLMRISGKASQGEPETVGQTLASNET